MKSKKLLIMIVFCLALGCIIGFMFYPQKSIIYKETKIGEYLQIDLNEVTKINIRHGKDSKLIIQKKSIEDLLSFLNELPIKSDNKDELIFGWTYSLQIFYKPQGGDDKIRTLVFTTNTVRIDGKKYLYNKAAFEHIKYYFENISY